MFTVFNTLTQKEEVFTPNDSSHVKMYVCGPTVYDRPHIGNARSIVFYDILFRLLCLLYPKVTFVRNITDVDDKIISRANEEGISTQDLTSKVIGQFHQDIASIKCLSPTFEPKATEYIPQILAMIKTLIHNNHAYVAENGDVMFSVLSYPEYGKLSKRRIADMQAGSRIAVSEFKKNEYDFVLWKKAKEGEIGWPSEFSFGRPGWHIECSAMSVSLLGMNFDIHGGGIDLQFPHHENEIAQSQCAHPHQQFAKYWVHNGFLTVEGEKMSKSLGNFITIKDLLDKGYTGSEIRFTLLNTHYRKPLSFSGHAIETSRLAVQKFYKTLNANADIIKDFPTSASWGGLPSLAQNALLENINISKFTALMHGITNDIKNTNDLKGKTELLYSLHQMCLFIDI